MLKYKCDNCGYEADTHTVFYGSIPWFDGHQWQVGKPYRWVSREGIEVVVSLNLMDYESGGMVCGACVLGHTRSMVKEMFVEPTESQGSTEASADVRDVRSSEGVPESSAVDYPGYDSDDYDFDPVHYRLIHTIDIGCTCTWHLSEEDPAQPLNPWMRRDRNTEANCPVHGPGRSSRSAREPQGEAVHRSSGPEAPEGSPHS